jgi:glutamate synthase domain-containing protein 3
MSAHNLIDLAAGTVRQLNSALHELRGKPTNDTLWRVANPRGLHSVAAGVDAPIAIEVDGPVGYYCGGMNKQARITVNGNAGVGLGENIMSGFIHVKGDASQSAGATGCGGMIVIDGNASARCGISMKGVDIVVKGSVGHMSAFMAQAGHLVVLGDAGEALGDSLYEAKLFVRGSVASLGADCVEKEMRDEHRAALALKLQEAGIAGEVDIAEFKRYGSARTLYHFHVDNVSSY